MGFERAACKNYNAMKEKYKPATIVGRYISRPQVLFKFHLLAYSLHKIIFQIYGI